MIRRFELACDASCPASCNVICYGKTKEQAVAQVIRCSPFCVQLSSLSADTFAVLSESEIDLATTSYEASRLFGTDKDENYKRVLANLQELASTAKRMRDTEVVGAPKNNPEDPKSVLQLRIALDNVVAAIYRAVYAMRASLEDILAERVERR